VKNHFLKTVLFELERTRRLGARALAQVTDEQLYWRPDEEANSLAILVQHLHGNMMSRWTDFLTSDGEKPSRRRDAEFEPLWAERADIDAMWDEGWECCLGAIRALKAADLRREVTIRGEPLTAVEAILRQVSHYAYHVGQMVQLARQICGPANWNSLSIPRGRSAEFDRGTYKSP
jgi:hypothetical protein